MVLNQINHTNVDFFFLVRDGVQYPRISDIHSRINPFYSRNFTLITQEITNTLLAYDYQEVIVTDKSPMWKCHWSVLLRFHARTSQKMHKNRSQSLVAGPLILNDNTRPHIMDVVTKKTSQLWVGSVTLCKI